MKVRRVPVKVSAICNAVLCAGLLIAVLASTKSLAAEEPGAASGAATGAIQGAAMGAQVTASPVSDCNPSQLDSPYIPVDSWVYPAVLRLYSLGYIDTVFLGMRPWTRSSIEHMLEDASARIEDGDGGPADDEAQGIYEALMHELRTISKAPAGRMKATHASNRFIPSCAGLAGRPSATAITWVPRSLTTMAALCQRIQ
jgi:hypothetical protein